MILRSFLIAASLAFVWPGGLPAQESQSPWPTTVVPDPEQSARREILISHGISPTPEALLRFLREGFPAPAAGQTETLPADPPMKIQVVDAAIRELGVTGAAAGVPALIEIAERKGPPGVSSIIARDFEDTPVQAVDEQTKLARRVLSLNAVSALGLIGDSSAEQVILELMRTEVGSAFVTRGAESIGMMGSASGLPAVVLLASDPASPDSVPAFATIFTLTGRNYGYTQETSLARRRELIAEMRTWFEAEGPNLTVQRVDVIRRQANPPLPMPIDPTSLRGLLRSSMDIASADRESYDRRFAAREKLAELAPHSFDELKAIASDPREDLDIRRAALRWTAISNPSKAGSVVRKQKNDENQAIAETARIVEKDIPGYIKDQKKGS